MHGKVAHYQSFVLKKTSLKQLSKKLKFLILFEFASVALGNLWPWLVIVLMSYLGVSNRSDMKFHQLPYSSFRLKPSLLLDSKLPPKFLDIAFAAS